MQKFLRSSTVVFTLALVGSVLAYSQDQPAQPAHPHHQMHRREPDPHFETKMLTRRLNLTPEQAAAVEPILAERQERMKALMPARGSQQSTPPDLKAIHEQRKAVMDDTQQKLDAVLTPEQRQQMTEMRQRHLRGGSHGNWSARQGNTPSA